MDDDDDSEILRFENQSQKSIGYNFSKNVILSSKIRFCEIEEDTLYRKCTFLDPRYRDYFLTDDKVKDEIKKTLRMKFSHTIIRTMFLKRNLNLLRIL